MPKRGLWLCLALAGALGSGCSRLSLGWRFAPWYLERKAAVFLAVPPSEREALGRDLEALLSKQAREQGPLLAAYLEQLALSVEAAKDADSAALLFNGLPKHWDALCEPAVAPAASWLAKHGSGDLSELEAAFRKAAEEDQAKLRSAPSLEQRQARLRGNLKDWLGALTPEQEQRVQAWAASMAFPQGAAFADRARRRQAVLEALRQGKGQPEVEAQLRRWWVTPEQDRDPAYAAELAAYRQGLKALLAEVLASLVPAQRSHLAAHLRGYGRELAKIAAKEGALVAELPVK